MADFGDGSPREDYGSVDPYAPVMTPEEKKAYDAKRKREAILGILSVLGMTTGLGAAGAALGGAGATGAASVPGAVSGAPITAASQGAAFGAPTVGMGAPSYAAVAGTGAGAATGGGFGGAGVTAPTFANPALLGGGPTTSVLSSVAPPVVKNAATGGTSKLMMGFSAAAGFLRDFLGNRNTKATEKQREAAALALLQLQQAHDAAMTDKKIAADKEAHDKDLADRRAGREAELALIDPYQRTRSQADTMVQLDKLGQKKAFNYDISGLPFGAMMPHSTGTIGYEPSAELKAWAATRGGDVRAGLPGATTGGASGPPTSNTMPVGGEGPRTVTPAGGPLSTTMPTMPEPSFVGDDLVDAPVSNVPLDSRELRMSIESLLRDTSATSRPMARRRRTPMAMPMR